MEAKNRYKANQITELLSEDLKDYKKGSESLFGAIKIACEAKNLENSITAFQRIKDFISVVEEDEREFKKLSDNKKAILILPLLTLEWEKGKSKTVTIGWLNKTYSLTW